MPINFGEILNNPLAPADPNPFDEEAPLVQKMPRADVSEILRIHLKDFKVPANKASLVTMINKQKMTILDLQGRLEIERQNFSPVEVRAMLNSVLEALDKPKVTAKRGLNKSQFATHVANQLLKIFSEKEEDCIAE